MLNAFILLVLALLFFAALFFIAYYLSQYFLNYKPSKKHIEKDLARIKEECKPMVKTLVPWNAEELRLLSFNAEEVMKKRGGMSSRKGLMYSIYHEPVLAYASKEYSDGKYGLLYVRTSNREFTYRILPQFTEVYINGRAYGRLYENGELRDPKNKKTLARLQLSEDRYLPIIVEDEEKGQLIDFTKTDAVNPRAYEFLQEMEDAQRLRFMALTLPRIIHSAREIK